MSKSRTTVGTVIGGVVIASLIIIIGLPAPRRSSNRRAGGRLFESSGAPGFRARALEAESHHALDPLGPQEIRLAVDTVRKERKLAESFRFVTVTLNEPSKSLVLHPRAGQSIAREAFLVLLDNATGTGYEAVVNLERAVGV